MIFQEATGHFSIVNIIVLIIIVLIYFIVGIGLTIYRASRQDLDTSYRKAILLCFIWLIFDFGSYPITYVVLQNLVTSDAMFLILYWLLLVIRLLVKILVGALVASKLYDLSFMEAINFVTVILGILFAFSIILNYLFILR